MYEEIFDVPFMAHLYFAENTRFYFLSCTISIRQTREVQPVGGFLFAEL